MMKKITWIVLALTSLATLLASPMLLGLNIPLSWLGAIGAICTVLGALGFIKARRARAPSALVYTLSLTIGALALLTGIYYGA